MFAADGTFEKSEGDNEGNQKYVYTEIANGTYSWDDTLKRVVLKPAKVADRQFSMSLLNEAEYRQAVQTTTDRMKQQLSEEDYNNYVLGSFSSVSAIIDYIVKREFFNRTFSYVFVEDEEGTALLLSEELPLSNGKNELNGQTFNEANSTRPARYVFSGTTYAKTDTWNISGTYAWNVEGRVVYFKPDTFNKMTNVQYFESRIGDEGADEFATVTDRHAAETNGYFANEVGFYDLTEKTID